MTSSQNQHIRTVVLVAHSVNRCVLMKLVSLSVLLAASALFGVAVDVVDAHALDVTPSEGATRSHAALVVIASCIRLETPHSCSSCGIHSPRRCSRATLIDGATWLRAAVVSIVFDVWKLRGCG